MLIFVRNELGLSQVLLSILWADIIFIIICPKQDMEQMLDIVRACMTSRQPSCTGEVWPWGAGGHAH